MALVSVGTGAVGKGSLSHSLSIRLIAPTVWVDRDFLPTLWGLSKRFCDGEHHRYQTKSLNLIPMLVRSAHPTMMLSSARSFTEVFAHAVNQGYDSDCR